MIRMCLIVLFCLISCWTVVGQVRHVEGVRSADLGFGVSGYGQEVHGGYVMYFGKKVYTKGILFYESGKDTKSPVQYSSIGADIDLAITLKKFKEVLYLNALTGLTVSSDQVTNNEQLKKSIGFTLPSAVKYGGLIGFEAETFLNERWVVVLSFSQKHYLSSDFGPDRWFGQLSLRYNLK